MKTKFLNSQEIIYVGSINNPECDKILVKAKCLKNPISAYLDTGSTVNLISLNTLKRLTAQNRKVTYLEPANVKLTLANGTPLHCHGITSLDLAFHEELPQYNCLFYVVNDLAIEGDILVGLSTMRQINITLLPSHSGILIGDQFIEEISPTVENSFSFKSGRPTKINRFRTIRKQSTPYNRKRTTERDSVTPITQVNTLTVAPSQTLPVNTNANNSVHNVNINQDNSLPPNIDNHTNSDVKTSDITSFHSACILKTILLPPKASLLVQLKTSIPNSEALLLIENSCIKGILPENSLIHTDNNARFNCLISNIMNKEFEIQAGTKIANVEIMPNKILEIHPNNNNGHIPIATITANNIDDKIKVNGEVHSPLDDPKRDQLLQVLLKYRGAIALNNEPLGKTNVVTHTINLKENTNPIYIPAYRIPASQKPLVEKYIQDMIDQGVIEISDSPYNFPIFLVPKKSGNNFRVVVDYRQLNKLVIPNRYPLPILSDVLQSIGEGNNYFTILDLLSGYYQIELDPNSKKYTAFSTHSGHYHYKRTPMGLSTSANIFQTLINIVFNGLLGDKIFAYLDDIILVSRTFEEHMLKLGELLNRLSTAGLKLKLDKCRFAFDSVTFLGHKLDKHGIHTLNDKIDAIKQYPQPHSIEKVRQFLGLVGFYRSFIPNFAKIAVPLFDLLKKDAKFIWTNDQSLAFTTLKNKLSSAPCLAYPNFTKEFFISTDACSKGVAGILMQLDNRGKYQPLAYTSRRTKKEESNYSVTDLEGLAVINALEKFKHIIYGYPITIFTDHQALQYLFDQKALAGRRARWKATILNFNCKIKYIKGVLNQAADALSRNPILSTITCAPITQTSSQDNFDIPTHDEIIQAQKLDPLWSKVRYALESGDFTMVPKIIFPIKNFEIMHDSLFRMLPKQKGHIRSTQQLVIPDSMIQKVLHEIHSSPHSGHPGKDKTLAQAKRSFFWPTMRKDINNFIDTCMSCAVYKGHTIKPSPLGSYPIPDKPFQVVSIDMLKLPLSHDKNNYLLVMVDHFSRYVILHSLKDKSAISVARAIIDSLICRFTTPNILISDNGGEFVNEILNNICKHYSIQKLTVLPYHPASNGLVERSNRKILEVLRHILQNNTSNWDSWIPQVEASINSAINQSTQESPHFIVYGVDKKLPYELLEQSSPLYTDNFEKAHIKMFQEIHHKIQTNLAASKENMIQKFNKKAKEVKIEEGDLVFQIIHERENKLSPKFKGPFRVIKRKQNSLQLLCLTTSSVTNAHVDNVKKVSRFLYPHTDDTSTKTQQTLPSNEKNESLPQKSTHPMALRSKNSTIANVNICSCENHPCTLDLYSFYT